VFTRVCFCNIRKHQLSHKSPTNRLLRVWKIVNPVKPSGYFMYREV
jgi:hypothetical protein